MTKEEKVPLRRRVNIKQYTAFRGSVKERTLGEPRQSLNLCPPLIPTRNGSEKPKC